MAYRDGRRTPAAPSPGLPPLFDRITPVDSVQLAVDVGPVPNQVGVLLTLEGDHDVDVEQLRHALGARVRSVPRLRQVLVGTPPGCGRPGWVDDPGFRIDDHVGVASVRAPGDEAALLDAATGVVTSRLPRSRPLWSVTVLSGERSGPALVVVLHHVLADGIGGLGILARLSDEAPAVSFETFPRPRPSWPRLARRTAEERLRALRRLPAGVRTLTAALTTDRPRSITSGAPTSLLRPTGPRRRTTVVRTALEPLHATARAHGATVNDVVLTAVTGALGGLLRERGEPVDQLVVSLPVSQREAAADGTAGNRTGVMPILLPVGGEAGDRLGFIAARTRQQKGAARQSSASLVAPAVRLLASLGLLEGFINRQRMVTAFVTNVRGPEQPLALAGRRIARMVPITTVSGNVTTAFAAMSYAGALEVAVVSDPDAVPDGDTLTRYLRAELDLLLPGSP